VAAISQQITKQQCGLNSLSNKSCQTSSRDKNSVIQVSQLHNLTSRQMIIPLSLFLSGSVMSQDILMEQKLDMVAFENAGEPEQCFHDRHVHPRLQAMH